MIITFGSQIIGGQDSNGGQFAPTVQVSNITATAIENDSISISWTRGNGSNVLIVMKSGGPVDSNPVDGVTYTANSIFGSGSQIGTGNYVVYSGPSTSVVVTGLLENTPYHIRGYEFL